MTLDEAEKLAYQYTVDDCELLAYQHMIAFDEYKKTKKKEHKDE